MTQSLILKRVGFSSIPASGCRMVRSHAAVGCPHAAAPATEAAAPEAPEASTAASRRIAGTSTHGYEPACEACAAGWSNGNEAGLPVDGRTVEATA
jgi:hypothetical protein